MRFKFKNYELYITQGTEDKSTFNRYDKKWYTLVSIVEDTPKFFNNGASMRRVIHCRRYGVNIFKGVYDMGINFVINGY